jgi:hypothetical protein
LSLARRQEALGEPSGGEVAFSASARRQQRPQTARTSNMIEEMHRPSLSKKSQACPHRRARLPQAPSVSPRNAATELLKKTCPGTAPLRSSRLSMNEYSDPRDTTYGEY